MRVQQQRPIAEGQQQNLTGGLEKKRRSAGGIGKESADKIVNADGKEQQDGRFGDHVPGIPDEGNPPF